MYRPSDWSSSLTFNNVHVWTHNAQVQRGENQHYSKEIYTWCYRKPHLRSILLSGFLCTVHITSMFFIKTSEFLVSTTECLYNVLIRNTSFHVNMYLSQACFGGIYYNKWVFQVFITSERDFKHYVDLQYFFLHSYLDYIPADYHRFHWLL